MDFNRLTRRELQALCKKNKIPANITNVAMTDALKALSFVEGIEEIMQPSQSETAQSSIESPDRKEVTSPRMPPTGGRPTRRRNTAKEETETLQPMTRTRRSTRKALAADADEAKDDTTETPSVVQTTRRALVNSVCRKMDSQLKECEEEEKKDALVAHVPSGVTSRRRRGVKEESVVKREYSTRRSARLAGKKVEVSDVNIEFINKEGENVNMNFKECLDNVEETSRITGIDAKTTVEKNPEGIDELEVVSARKHNMQIGEGDRAATVDNLEGKDESEDVPAEEHVHAVLAQTHHMQIGEEGDQAFTLDNLEGKDESEDFPAEEHAHSGKETELAATFEEETGQKYEVDGLKLDGENVDVNSSVEENLEVNDESEVVSVKELKITVEEEGENKAIFEAHGLKGEKKEVTEMENEKICLVFETGVEVDKDRCDKPEDCNGENMAMPPDMNDEVQERALDVCTFETETSVEAEFEAEIEDVESIEHPKEAEFEDKPCDIVETLVHETEDKSAVDFSGDTKLCNEIEEEIYEGNDMEFEHFPALNANEVVLEINANVQGDVDENELNVDKSPKSITVEAKTQGSDEVYQVTNSKIDAPSEISFTGLDSDLIVKPTCLTPYKSSTTKVSPMKKRLAILSDNKENIDSGSKIILTKERVKISKNTAENVNKFDDASLRKLTKMLKKKLQITNNFSKNENENPKNETKTRERSGRLVLQALPENNQLVDETQKN